MAIKIRPSQVGSLHKLLGVPQKDKIPTRELADKASDGPTMRKKKNFARNARKWSHMGGLSKLMGK